MDKVESLIETLETLSENERADVFDSHAFIDIVLGYITIIMKADGQSNQNIRNGLDTISFLMFQQDASFALEAYDKFLDEEENE